MAEEKPAAEEAAPEVGSANVAEPSYIVAVDHDTYTRQQLHRETMAMRHSGIKLDEAKRPGGYFIGVDGKPHDAEGRPIEEPEA